MAAKINFDKVFPLQAAVENFTYEIEGKDVTAGLPVRIRPLVRPLHESTVAKVAKYPQAAAIMAATNVLYRGLASLFPNDDVRKDGSAIMQKVTDAQAANRLACVITNKGAKWVPYAKVVENIDGEQFVPAFHANNYVYDGPKGKFAFLRGRASMSLVAGNDKDDLGVEFATSTDKVDNAKKVIENLAIIRAMKDQGVKLSRNERLLAPVTITQVYNGVSHEGATFSQVRATLTNVGDITSFSERWTDKNGNSLRITESQWNHNLQL